MRGTNAEATTAAFDHPGSPVVSSRVEVILYLLSTLEDAASEEQCSGDKPLIAAEVVGDDKCDFCKVLFSPPPLTICVVDFPLEDLELSLGRKTDLLMDLAAEMPTSRPSFPASWHLQLHPRP